MQNSRRALVLLGTLCVAVPATAGAQTFEAGVKVGAAVTGLPSAGQVVDQVVGAPSSESSSKMGLTGGAYVRFPIIDRLWFQPEAVFVMKGVNLNETANGGTVSARINYMDVPLLLRYRAMLHPDIAGFLVAGPNFGIKLSSSAQLDSLGKTTDLNIDPALKTLDLGLALGGGVEYRRYFIEGRFTAGLTDIASSSYPHADSLRNRTFSVLVGMALR